ncbi:MAG: PAS domain S-box protein, partial [bacterium]|nr:PAS domain S-box protein [bacterium]
RTTDLAESNEGLKHEIEERKQAEKALSESEEHFRTLAEGTFEAVVIHKEGVILEANKQYYKMFGYKPEELAGKNAIEITVAPESIEAIKTEVASGNPGPYEATGLKKDGISFPIEVRARAMEYHGRQARMAAIRDLSERKQAAEEKMKLEAQLHQSERMEAIGTLAGGIAHDFNNIL